MINKTLEAKTMADTKQRSLCELAPGSMARVVSVEGDGVTKRKVLDMGIVPGTELRVTRKAPLGDPIGVSLRGFELSLRKDEANLVIVRADECGSCGCCGGCH